MQRISWDEYFMILAKMAALRSTCIARAVGAIAVLDNEVVATGYVGSMPGAPHCSEQPEGCFRKARGGPEADKYLYCRSSHAEANVVAQAAKQGKSIKEATLYCTLFPCLICFKILAVAGIKEIVYELDYESLDVKRDEVWKELSQESKLQTRQLIISSETKEQAIEFILSITSQRKF